MGPREPSDDASALVVVEQAPPEQPGLADFVSQSASLGIGQGREHQVPDCRDMPRSRGEQLKPPAAPAWGSAVRLGDHGVMVPGRL
jgi:hypothetical protein